MTKPGEERIRTGRDIVRNILHDVGVLRWRVSLSEVRELKTLMAMFATHYTVLKPTTVKSE